MIFDFKIWEDFKKRHFNAMAKNDHSDGSPESIIEELKTYLDSVDMKMSKPLYQYDEENIKTHKFLDGISSYSKKNGKWKYKNVYNPNFKYGHVKSAFA